MNWQTEQTIYKTQDEFGELHVKEQGLLRTLYFGDHKKQSSIFLPEPAVLVLSYAQAMMTSLFFCHQPKKVLIVGLGGGSLFHFINNFYPDCTVDIVELRQSVIDVATQLFKVPLSNPQLNLVHTDGIEFVAEKARRNESYDLVLIDAFDQWGPSEILSNQVFIGQCRELIKDEGVCTFNLWNRKEDRYHQSLKSFKKHFSNNLLELSLGSINSNVVLHGFNKDSYRQKLKGLGNLPEKYKAKFGIDYVRYHKLLIRQNGSTFQRLKNAVLN